MSNRTIIEKVYDGVYEKMYYIIGLVFILYIFIEAFSGAGLETQTNSLWISSSRFFIAAFLEFIMTTHLVSTIVRSLQDGKITGQEFVQILFSLITTLGITSTIATVAAINGGILRFSLNSSPWLSYTGKDIDSQMFMTLFLIFASVLIAILSVAYHPSLNKKGSQSSDSSKKETQSPKGEEKKDEGRRRRRRRERR